MGKLSDLPIFYRLFMKAYPWRRRGPVPWSPLRKPLKDCRLALITSSGLVTANQTPFDKSVRGGDCSFREIPSDINTADLIDTHRSRIFDHSGIQQDPNLALPINRMRECEQKGRIGSLNHRQLSFMGSITARERLIKGSIPAALKLLVGDKVDVALLIPV
jgi:D-proline reductase (dithiol) PrdB